MLVFVSAGAGAALMFVELRHPAYLIAHPPVEQIIGARTERDKSCEEFGQQHRKEIGSDLFRFSWVHDFYSEKLDTCVQAMESETENFFVVADISGGFIKRSLDGFGDMGQTLFDCDTEGVDHALIERVRVHRGYVDKLPYAQYMDDFNGGPPRTIKSSSRMLTRNDCERFFLKELKEVR